MLALLLLLLTFLRAGTAPPCDAHHQPGASAVPEMGAPEEVAEGAHHLQDHTPQGEHGDGERCCECLGACHPTTAVGIAGGTSSTVVASVVLLATGPVPCDQGAAPLARRTYLLPFSTAPPVGEV